MEVASATSSHPPSISETQGVKPLRWKGPDSAGEYHSLDGLWGYIIRGGTGNGFWLTEVGNYYPTVEAAQAGAWSDYERRISAALISPSPKPQTAGEP